MDVNITGRHLEITPPIQEYAQKRLAKLSRYYDRVHSAVVIADKAEHHHYDLEVKVSADEGAPFIAKVHGEDLYACLDQAADKLERQLTDHKEMMRSRKGKTSMSG